MTPNPPVDSASDAASSAPVDRALLATLHAGASPDVRRALADGDVLAALSTAVDEGDSAAVSDVLRIGWFELVRQQHPDLRAVLERMPISDANTNPLAAMALGVVYNADRHRRAKAMFYFGTAALAARSRLHAPSAAERVLVLTAESAALRLLGRHPRSVKIARAALQTLSEMSEEPRNVIGHVTRIYCQLGMSLYYGGFPAQAFDAFLRGFAEGAEENRSSFGNLAMMAWIRAHDGDLGEARELVALGRDGIWTERQRSMYPGSIQRVAEALLALEAFDLDSARERLRTMEHDPRSIEYWIEIASVEALISLAAGDAAGALSDLDSAIGLRGAEGRSAAARERLAPLRSLLHTALGNYEAAARTLARDAGDGPSVEIERARLDFMAGRSAAALARLRTLAGDDMTMRTRVNCLALEAAIALRIEPRGRSRAVIRQLAAMMERTGQRFALHLLADADFVRVRDALAEAGHSDIVAGGVGGLLTTPERPQLSNRELVVLKALARPGSTAAIAAQLHVSPNTAKTHVKNVYRKLGVRTREEALTTALHHRLIDAAQVAAASADPDAGH